MPKCCARERLDRAVCTSIGIGVLEPRAQQLNGHVNADFGVVGVAALAALAALAAVAAVAALAAHVAVEREALLEERLGKAARLLRAARRGRRDTRLDPELRREGEQRAW